jgi:hypothetical protein
MRDYNKLRGLLQTVANLAEHEITCDESNELVHRYVDFRVYNDGPVPEDLKGIEQHLSVCPQCMEVVEAIVSATRAQQAGLATE